MSTRNTVLSIIQKGNKKGSAMNSAFDNANEVAAQGKKKEDKKAKK